MCESAVYIRDEKGERLVSDEVARVDIDQDQVIVTPMLQKPIALRARVVEVDLLGHRITLDATGVPPEPDGASQR